MNKDLVLVIDFGGQYSQLIARRVRECGIYCEIIPYTYSIEKIKEKSPKGMIFTGGPNSVYGDNSPTISEEIFNIGVPILGICYGAQLMAHVLGGEVKASTGREYGKTDINIDNNSLLFKGVSEKEQCWMSHTDFITKEPKGFEIIATTPKCPVGAIENSKKALYGVQFHPEVEHTPAGRLIIENFLYKICKLEKSWTMASFAEEKIKEIKSIVGDKKLICALSGGVDSSVAALLIHKAVGKQLTCIFVDHGLLRKDEGDMVEKVFKEEFDLNIIRVNAKDRFLSKLKSVSEPEKKRKIIGEEFIRIFEEEANKLGEIDFLVQGTIYPDVVESGTDTSAVIKSHHNVGGLPEDMNFKLIEPLRELFKDEVRAVGEELGIPHKLVWRQPFPGPGLAIRVLGEVTEEKLSIVREADSIMREEISNAGLEETIWQYFACLPNIQSVGVMGDERTYCHTIALRAVNSSDGMTSDWSRIPYEVLDKISRRIVNEVKDVNRIVYDITSKPPSTIEWE
ncbi:glutamine-hydrolyzing GMP synthase [Clostridium algidicarnis]|uniref:glutamine-hydrolyzing GMP synthase n=1 Tax=Clostridium algidicarnis TaxID=37659 RepID=UPI001C0C1B14|nr:glutamine-hydrolyzing GMP synthase [Clostridium algidicarnis]MBU3197627.1 glutamine-hydrolyzing GMP synthase [Clostridium algidicarnis]MBU3228412.1 glutamine-hydrolyzing GMP synthase [Clostridium algidicarnis]MBU3252156.1 glutamine-hydrolyzing GMP synthase [Clostridium algidicarnis]